MSDDDDYGDLVGIRQRRVKVIAWVVIAALIVTAHSWGALTIPVALAFVLSAAVVLGTAWGDRPWRARQ